MLNCRNATRLMSEQRERKLTLMEKIHLYMHIGWCSACRNFGLQMRLITKMSKSFNRNKTDDNDVDHF